MTKSSFETFALGKDIQAAIRDMGFTEPSPIQVQAIPAILSGRDVVGLADTGTGKTAAFAIPLIEGVDLTKRYAQALVVCPTRELAIQVASEFQKIARYKKQLRIVSLYGGQPIAKQIRALQQKPQIIVGTPGRIQDLLDREFLDLEGARMVVLDEADEMLNMGFRDAIERILEYTLENRQTILFSATMPKSILNLTEHYQKDPIHIQIEREKRPVPQIEQCYIELHKREKTNALCHLLDVNKFGTTMIFCNTKWQVEALAKHLKKAGYPADALHGGMTQSKRDKTMLQFRKGRTKFLIATDVAARGIDVNDVEAVFNYDFPKDTEFYVHRIGRTGRAGKTGKAYTFVEQSELSELKRIRKYPNVNLTRQELPALA